MGADLTEVTVYHHDSGPVFSLLMTYNDASNFADQWKLFTKDYTGQEITENPMVELSGKVSITDNRIVTWYLDLRDIKTLSLA